MKKLLTVIFTLSLASAAFAAPKVCDNANSAGCQQAYKMLKAAWVIAVGDDKQAGVWTEHADNMVYHKIVTAEKFASGVSLKDATEYWKFFLSELSPGVGGYATVAVNNAFKEVYGRNPMKAESDPWLALIKQKKAWYTTIVLAESKKLKDDSTAYAKVIRAAFSNSYARWEDDKEKAYWMANRLHYRLMRQTFRNELYKEGNEAAAKKLTALAIQNSTKAKTGKTVAPGGADIHFWYLKFMKTKLLYDEMMAAFGTPVG